MESLKAWFKRTFSDPQIVMLALILLISALIIFGLGKMLAPVFTAMVIAYLLEVIVDRLERLGMARIWAVIIVFLLFLAILFFLLFGLVPMLTRQLSQLVQQIPTYLAQGQTLLAELPERYPQFLSEEQLQAVFSTLSAELAVWGQQLLNWTLSSAASLVGLLVFLVLVPVLVFFFLKDKDLLVGWLVSFLPRDRQLVSSIWTEVEGQIANYVRGKVGEIVIVGSVTYVTFTILGLQYSALLATVVGFSVLIPYIGAAVATIPVALVAFFQFGWGWDFGAVIIAYGVIQALDGNVLVPVMFSEAVNLHPVAIIVAILVFGGLWGFWGIFFAIPLATLVQAVLKAWPRPPGVGDDDSEVAEAEAPASSQSTSEA